MTNLRKPRVVFQPNAYNHVQSGINQILNVLRPTLGPYPRVVAHDSKTSAKGIELLDEGGTIARRIIEIADRDADVGAMYIRQMLWTIHQRVGDGTATAAVLCQIVYNEGLRYVAAGGNPMILRRHLEAGMRLILAELDKMVTPIKGKDKLAQVAESICYDPDMAKYLGEIFDIIGEHGRLETRSGKSFQHEREYVEGMYWKGGLLSRRMITDHARGRTKMEQVGVVMTDMDLTDPRDLLPALTLCVKANIKEMILVVRKISDDTIGLLMGEKTVDKIRVVPVKTPGTGLTDQAANLIDIAVLTGGQPILQKAGQTLRDIDMSYLGRARRAWANKDHFGLSGGQGNARQLREHIAKLRRAYGNTEDADDKKRLLERIGKLLGGSATLWIGGVSDSEIKQRKNVAERTARALRGAVRDGVLPGGGVALLNCRPMLTEKMEQSTDADERAAYRILLRAMEEPIRTLVANAGYEPSEVMGEIKLAGNGHGFDLSRGQVVDMSENGIFDVAATEKEAVRSAISTAALALTIDVLIRRKRPEQSLEP